MLAILAVGKKNEDEPANVMGIFSQLGILELVKVLLDLQPDHRRRRVCQIMLLDALIHHGYWDAE